MWQAAWSVLALLASRITGWKLTSSAGVCAAGVCAAGVVVVAPALRLQTEVYLLLASCGRVWIQSVMIIKHRHSAFKS